MKKLILAVAIVGMTGFAFGQQAASASKDSKDSKCSKACMKSCGNDKTCKKGACAKDSKSTTSTTTTKTASDKK